MKATDGAPKSLEILAERAQLGDRDALEELVRGVQDRIYGLSMRMLWHPEDARDATQEILVRIITGLSSFRAESAFTTWAYRVAANYLLTTRKRRAERDEISFDEFGRQLAEGLSDAPITAGSAADEALLVEEVKIGCTQGMLLCLDRPHRLAYILGELFDVTGGEGGYVLGISAAAFRKRLSRSRERVRSFMRGKCGLVNPENACRCSRRVDHAVGIGRVDPENLLFARHSVRVPSDHPIRQHVDEMEQLERAAAVMRSHPTYAAPDTFLMHLQRLIESGEHAVMRS